MDFKISITHAIRRRKLKNGKPRLHDQYYCEFRDPKLNRRRRRAFKTRKDAEAFRNALLLKVAQGSYVDERTAPTVYGDRCRTQECPVHQLAR